MVGPKFALLRQEFAALREYSLTRRKNCRLKNILIFMGGVDQYNATGRVLEALKSCLLPSDCTVSVVLGRNSPWSESNKLHAKSLPWSTKCLVNISDMAQRMADSDLAIGAAGSTSWERCCLGLPTLVVVLANNQNRTARALHQLRAANSLGSILDVDEALAKELESIQSDESVLGKMTSSAGSICDGTGAAKLTEILSTTNK